MIARSVPAVVDDDDDRAEHGEDERGWEAKPEVRHELELGATDGAGSCVDDEVAGTADEGEVARDRGGEGDEQPAEGDVVRTRETVDQRGQEEDDRHVCEHVGCKHDREHKQKHESTRQR